MAPPPGGAKGFLPGPKTPTWGCPGGGLDENWRTRPVCRGCGHCAPSNVLQAAAMAARAAGPSPGKIRPPSGQWARGGPPPSQAEQRALERVDALQKQVEKLTLQLGSREEPRGDLSPQEEWPDLARLQAAQAAVALAFGQDSESSKWVCDKIQEARKAKLQAKPLQIQAISAQRWAAKQGKQAEAAIKKVCGLEEQMVTLQKQIDMAKEEEATARLEHKAAEEALQEVQKKALVSSQGEEASVFPNLPEAFKAMPEVAAQLQQAHQLLKDLHKKAEEWAKQEQQGKEAAAGEEGGTPGSASMDVDAGARVHVSPELAQEVFESVKGGGDDEDMEPEAVKKRMAQAPRAAAKRLKSSG